MGPAGADGLNGADGAPGKDGVDQNATCTECHNANATVELKLAQWRNSVHATSDNAAYGNRAGCVQCHTSQGFLEAVAEGSTAAISLPNDPMQINCYTCHKIHETGTSDDWALTKPGAETLIVKDIAGADVIWDKGNSNQCAACHQGRFITTLPVAGGDYTISSSSSAPINTRVGFHHAPMTNLILGKLPTQQGTGYSSANPHSTSDGCLSCHMAKPYGYLAGGHQMGMMYESHGTETLLSTGCLVCHTTYTATTIKTKMVTLQTEVETKLATLQAKLLAAGIYNPTTGLANAGTFKSNIALAYINYNAAEEDRSEGMHNPGYIKTLLDNAIAVMVTEGF
jgi:Zn-finger protein